MSATPHDDNTTPATPAGRPEHATPAEPLTRAETWADDPEPVTPAPAGPYPPGAPRPGRAAPAGPPPPGAWRGRPYGVGGWRRRPLQLVLVGLVGLVIGCFLGGAAVAAVALVVGHHDGYHHSRYEPDRRDWGPRGDHRPGMPGDRPMPQPSQS